MAVVDNTKMEARREEGTGWFKTMFISQGQINVVLKEMDSRGVMMFTAHERFNHWDLETAQILFDSL